MWRSRAISITVTTRDDTVGRIIQQGAADKLQSGFILREVNKDAFACSSPVIQRGQDSDPAIGDSDEINVWAVQEEGRTFGFADEMREAAQ
jgi:hypothetical protein